MILGDLIWRITGDTSNFDKAVPASEKKAVSFTKSLKGFGIASAAAFATVAAGVAVMGKFQKAFAEDEIAAVRLSAALKTAEQIAPSAIGRFNELANTLQATSIFGDDATKTQIAYLASLGKTESEINKVITAAADLAAATGISLETAVQQLNATLVGSAGYLGRQNAAVRALTEEELKAGRAIEIVAQQYEGYAKAVGQSAFGGNEQFKNSVGDLGEAIGRLIESSGWKELQSALTKLATKGAASLNKALDLTDAQRALASGTATIEQQILVLQNQVYTYDATIKSIRLRIAAQKEMGVSTASLTAELESELAMQEDVQIQLTRLTNIYKEQTKAADDQAAANAANAIFQAQLAEARKKRQEEEKKRLEAEEALIARMSAYGIASGEAEIEQYDELIKRAERLNIIMQEKKAAQKYAENFSFALGLVNTAFGQLGEALGAGELSWKSFAKAGLGAIASILQAMGAKSAYEAAESFAAYIASGFVSAKDLAASLKYAGASALAYTGAGIVNGYAGSFADGGVIGGNVYNDGLVARVSSGEEVVNRNDRTQLIDYLKNAQSNQTIIVPVSIDGREVARVVTRYQTKGKA